MPKFSLNPTKGVTLKNPVGWIRKTVDGKRVRKQVNFTDAVLNADTGRFLYRENGKSYRISPFDIRYLANRPVGMGKWGEDLFVKSNKAGRNISKTEALDLITERFNLYMRYEGWKLPVAYVYSQNSRVIRGTESLLAVRLKDGSKGWLTAEGRFIDQDTMRELLYDVDQTLPASTSDISLMDAWDAMSPQQKADFADIMQDFDWEQFWEEIGSDDPARDLSAATSAYYDLIEIMGDVLGW